MDLDQVRQDIWEIILPLSDEMINQSVGHDQWTIAQVLDHLYLVEQAIVGQLSNEDYEEVDASFVPKPLDFILDRSIKVPAGDTFVSKFEFQSLNSLKSKLDQSRQQLLEIAHRLGPEQIQKKAQRHQAFGLLTLSQWIEFIALHEQRHLEQIKEISQKLQAKDH
ncbi:DinB family protein [Hazenella coriacea]|nr:DinB family protein [Hazenella coriacea]